MNDYEKKLRQSGLHEPATTYLADPLEATRVAAGFPAYYKDGDASSTGQFVGPDGKVMASKIKPVASSRTLTAADLEGELSLASAITLTVPVDATLGITDPVGGFYSPVVAFYCAGTAPTINVAAITMRGTTPTFAQYGFYGFKRVGVNEWAWL